MARVQAGRARGLLKATAAAPVFHGRWLPSAELAAFVEHFWTVRWDFRGLEAPVAENLPHPTVHLIVEEGRSCLHGVPRGRHVRALDGAGRVFGVKFWPGGFHPFYGKPVSGFTGRGLPLDEAFGPGGEAFAARILALEEDEARMREAEAFLGARLPAPDPNVELIGRLVERIIADRSITKAEQAAEEAGLGLRALQRLFSRYVGISPKWMIQRYRLHEALEQLDADAEPDWPRLALELGYFDQAHFIKDFKALVGRTPSEYARKF